MSLRFAGILALLGAACLLRPAGATAQPLDMSKGGPVTITSRDGIDWQQADKVVIARGDAKAVRDNVTVTADRLIAHYRPKAPAPGTPPAPAPTPVAAKTDGTAASPIDTETGGNEIYRLEADGNVRIFTPTDVAVGDHATYDMDQAVLLLTGRNLKLTRPAEVITARDTMEYWSQLHRSVARGNAVVVTSDARRLAGDTLVAYSSPPATQPAPGSPPATPAPAKAADSASGNAAPADPLGASGKIEKVEAFGNVSVRTQTDTVTGDRGVYVPDTGIARIGGNVRITRGQNQLNGAEAEVDMKTGLSRLTAGTSKQVHGLVMPNDASAQVGSGAASGKPPQPKPNSNATPAKPAGTDKGGKP
jgi:lipopolysaccharide export system protein LptA